MFKVKSLCFAIVIAVAAWPAAAGARNLGVMVSDDTAYIAAVEVVEKDTDVPAGFADALRERLVRAAAFYGDAGRPITLRVELERVHFKNPAAAMLIGDDNRAKGHVFVVDPSGGQELGTFAIDVNAERPGDLAGEIALDVVGAFDPTGAVDMAHMAGSASSAQIDRDGTTAAMITNFADETLRETFGDVRSKAARARSEAH